MTTLTRGRKYLGAAFPLAAFLVFQGAFPPHVLTDDSEEIPCGMDARTCRACHQDDTRAIAAVSAKTACSPFCITCHKDMGTHHPVGTEIKSKLPGTIRLTPSRKMACASCHSLEGKRYDSVSWKSESLYDRWFRRNTRHKTYYLVMINNRGQLCRVCH